MDKKKPNRNRPERIVIDVTLEEKEQILKNAANTNFNSLSSFARKMLLDGFVVNMDYAAIKELTKEVGAIGNNINQIARRMNETRNVYDDDIEEIKRNQKEITALLRKTLLKLT